jgi:hypothetical protein
MLRLKEAQRRADVISGNSGHTLGSHLNGW